MVLGVMEQVKGKVFKIYTLYYIFFLWIVTIFPSKTILNAADLSINMMYYSYEELDSNNQFFMSDKSSTPFLGFGIREWDLGATKDIRNNYSWKFLYTIEYSQGKVNYRSNGTGSMVKDYYRGRLESYISKKIYVNRSKARPFLGLGYRHLFDNSVNKLTSTNHAGYDRVSQYYYVPIGMIWYLNNEWTIKSQYNYLLQGKQTSYLKNAFPATYNVNPINTQRIGGGFDLTLNKKLNSNWHYYGFFRRWDVGVSDVVSCSISLNCTEPKNSTNEIGVGISFSF